MFLRNKWERVVTPKSLALIFWAAMTVTAVGGGGGGVVFNKIGGPLQGGTRGVVSREG